jgi:pyridoxal phosphate enzyme (YggS family)
VEAEAIALRVRAILGNIERAAARAGRSPDTIRLVAATKSVSVDRIRQAIAAGVRILGENRIQEALPKIETIGGREGLSWHFIGRLQRRKVRTVVGLFEMIHSVDSLELATEIDRRAAATGVRQAVLLEVNIGGEFSKAGFTPSGVADSLAAFGKLVNLEVKGLMAIPPPTAEPGAARSYFRQVRELARALQEKRLRNVRMDELSMGMSQDYELAVEEGATLVRIGTAIFGARPV